jgi:MFS transporter, ACDE family, multidrug resistance protein
MENGKKPDLIALSSIPLVMTLGNSMLIPVLPTIEKELGITKLQSSLIITIYSILAIIFIPVAGYLSDRVGRKKVIIPSLALAGVGGLISGFASWKIQNPYTLILVGRLIQGIGSSGAFPVVIPTVGDMFKNEDDVSKGLGIIETSNTFGKVLSPVIGAVLAAWIWYVPFFAIPVFCAISILLMFFLVKIPANENSENHDSFKSFIQRIREIFKKNGKWLSAVFYTGWVCMFVYFAFLFYFSSVLESKYGIDGVKKGFVLAIPLLFLCSTSYGAGKFDGKVKHKMKWVSFGGILLAGLALFWIGFIENLTFLIVVLSVAGIGIGATLPSLDALITEGICKENRGTMTSIYSSMRLTGVALAPPVTAALTSVSASTAFIVVSATAIIAAAAIVILIKPTQEDEQQY